MKKNYYILISWSAGGYSSLWQRKGITLDEAQKTLAIASKNWHGKGVCFICSPKRAERLLTGRK